MAVYFIQAGRANGLIKIGTSRDVWKREKTLRQIHKEPLFLLAVMDGAHKEEHAMHKRFARWQYQGEWFYPARELLDFILTLPEPHVSMADDGRGWAFRFHAAFLPTNV